MYNFFKNKLTSIGDYSLSRYYTGVILVTIIALVIALNIKFLLWLVVGIFYIIAFYEALKLYNIEEKTYLYISSCIIWIIAYFHTNPIYISIVVLVVMASYNAYHQNIKNKDYLVILYPTIPFLCFFSIYKNFGVMAIIWLILSVALADIGAYFGGRAFGKSPLSPVSPKKTLEGALIGLVVSTLIGTMIGIGQKDFISAFFITFFVALISIFGDLYESLLKRTINVKDSGNILPGHGGILDRVDGLLFGSVIMIFLLEWFK
ncbi:phosphatidate cytidylyltransferase [Helicobacter sp. MIT 14-3879]|uniref:phosphatidate cytidylyltransferase n=1 Tax=Helicobacter sp. MIT 14-3879 TaxID=2040649 RepID=UPI000E1E43D0|nr:phosphatidate cytidylyltransferase [Helicobacter sp. MIT 14-3879]RDU63989.1 phosphatidate cytidylyltransferase [Helicobacter sp. MIT 14-3879]